MTPGIRPLCPVSNDVTQTFSLEQTHLKGMHHWSGRWLDSAVFFSSSSSSFSLECARTVKRPGGPVSALLQNSEIDLFTHSPFASRPLTHSHGAPFGGALRAR
eukprot:COSAG02_NODE_994_length_15358_cov_42.651812_9_plen_103_part_00